MHELSRSFIFEAAHTLQRDIQAEGSRRIHGHSYRATATLAGQPDPVSGMLLDLGHFDQALGRIRERLDHHFLDEVPGLGPATLENLSHFIYAALAPELPGLVRVTVSRDLSGDSCCYWPDPASPTPGTGASLLEQWSQLA